MTLEPETSGPLLTLISVLQSMPDSLPPCPGREVGQV